MTSDECACASCQGPDTTPAPSIHETRQQELADIDARICELQALIFRQRVVIDQSYRQLTELRGQRAQVERARMTASEFREKDAITCV